jgi:putative DNA primase/helicase
VIADASVAHAATEVHRWPLSNAEFLAGIFGTALSGRPFVTSFSGDPREDVPARWRGYPWTPGVSSDAPGLNWYFTLATYREKRNTENCTAVHGLMLDDLATLDRLAACPPSIVTETSAGNHQAIYLFDGSGVDLRDADALLKRFIAAGLCDPNSTSPATRWCRLPFGINGKGSPAFACRLVQWSPHNRYSVSILGDRLALPVAAMQAPRPHVAANDPPADQDDLRSALAVIPADDRDLWVKIGHCLKAWDAVHGFVLWAEWSESSSLYQPGDERRFHTFKPDRAGAGGVFAEAKARGWRRLDPAAIFSNPAPLPPGAVAHRPAPTTPKQAATSPSERILAEDPLATARELVRCEFTREGLPALKFWKGSFYRWQDAAWADIPDADARAAVYRFIDRHGFADFRPTARRVSDVLDALKAAVNLEARHAPPCWLDAEPRPPAGELIACSNGTLHLPTRTMHAASPLLFNLNAVPFAYEPNAPAPAGWLSFLGSLWPNDPEAIATLQEIFGYLLTPDTSQQKLFLIVGPKRSGKGTLGRILGAMLGEANVASPGLSGMGGQFGPASLVGKLVAVMSDVRLGGRADPAVIAENLLRVSGEDRVEVDRKNRDSLTLRLGVRFVLMTNELPKLVDASGALASRFIVLTIRESFYGREDPGLTNRLLAELPGILAWAVEGWHRLHARGHFVTPQSSREAVQDLADLGSPIGAFLRERCDVRAGAEVSAADLFSAWCLWCVTQGHKNTGSASSFGRDLHAALPGITKAQARIPPTGARVWVYRGVSLAQDVTSANALQRG